MKILGIEISCDETPHQIGRCAFCLTGEAETERPIGDGASRA